MANKNRELEPLPARLVDRLRVLAGERDGVAAVALSALSIEDLNSLASHGIIEQINDRGEEVDAVVITNHGRKVIAESAQ